jgi:hypothetical protein
MADMLRIFYFLGGFPEAHWSCGHTTAANSQHMARVLLQVKGESFAVRLASILAPPISLEEVERHMEATDPEAYQVGQNM